MIHRHLTGQAGTSASSRGGARHGSKPRNDINAGAYFLAAGFERSHVLLHDDEAVPAEAARRAQRQMIRYLEMLAGSIADGSNVMTYVVTESCINCKHADCVEVCPVDAIFFEANVPLEQKAFVALNVYYTTL